MANRIYKYHGRVIPRSRAVDEDGAMYPGVTVNDDPDREANAAAVANGYPNAKAYRAAINQMLAVGRRKPPEGGQLP
jgi:hypothetical protein